MSVVVADFGSSLTRIGFAGAGEPVFCARTLAALDGAPAGACRPPRAAGGSYAYDVDGALMASAARGSAVRSPLDSGGLVEDWGAASALLEAALESRCGLPPARAGAPARAGGGCA